MDNCNIAKTLIIAEAGVNHNGSLSLAKRLADVAQKAGADIVKYQVFRSDSLVTGYAEKAQYQKEAGESDQAQLDMLRSLELSYEDFLELKRYCESIGIAFLATAFDKGSMDFLVEELGVKMLKIPSGEINNYPYLVQVAQYGKPVLLSCGMSSLEEVAAALKILRDHGAGDITLLHCNTQYPTPYEDVNLRAMGKMGEEFEVSVGYSDHTQGVEVPIAAVAMGARVIEKHFTLDKTMDGPDHKTSLDPAELTVMVSAIRHIELALGTGEKRITESERENRAIARKSIVAARPIHKGEMLSDANLTTKRPGTGLSPMLWPSVIGTVAQRDYEADEMLEAL